MRLFLSASIAVLLAGCGTPQYVDPMLGHIRGGRCYDARHELEMNEKRPGVKAFFQGAILLDCDKQPEKAFPFLNLSARYGFKPAREVLAQHNQPIPYADIEAAEERASDARTALGLQLLNHGRQAPSSGTFIPSSTIPRDLRRSWNNRGDSMCQYSDGSVINMGMQLCPLMLN